MFRGDPKEHEYLVCLWSTDPMLKNYGVFISCHISFIYLVLSLT